MVGPKILFACWHYYSWERNGRLHSMQMDNLELNNYYLIICQFSSVRDFQLIDNHKNNYDIYASTYSVFRGQ